MNSALHPSRVAKSSTSFGWGKGGKATAAGWCDPLWFVISCIGVVISITNCYMLTFTFTFNPLHHKPDPGGSVVQ